MTHFPDALTLVELEYLGFPQPYQQVSYRRFTAKSAIDYCTITAICSVTRHMTSVMTTIEHRPN